MSEQDRQISEVVAEQGSRLRNFIRRRVPDPADVEDILQEVYYELVEANRLLMPIEHVTGWLFRVARNRITDLFRKKKPDPFSDAAIEGDEGELLQIEDLLPSADAGPEAVYVRKMLLDELELALAELPKGAARGVHRARTGRAKLQGAVGGNGSKREHATLAQAVRGAVSARKIAKGS